MQEIEKYAQENVNILLVGNKSDLADKREVSFKEGHELAQSYEIPFMETSAANAHNIKESFKTMAEEIMKRVEREPVRPI